MDSVRLRELDGKTTNPKDIQIAERCTSATTTREVQLLGFYLSEFEYFWDQQIPRSDCMNKKTNLHIPKRTMNRFYVKKPCPHTVLNRLFRQCSM